MFVASTGRQCELASERRAEAETFARCAPGLDTALTTPKEPARVETTVARCIRRISISRACTAGGPTTSRWVLMDVRRSKLSDSGRADQHVTIDLGRPEVSHE